MMNLVLMIGTLAAALTTAAGIANSNGHTFIETTASSSTFSRYKGHERRRAHYEGMDYIYSDGVFEDDPKEYSPHLATLSAHLVNASDNYVKNGDYSDGAHTLVQAYNNIGLKNIYVNDGYKHKPTADSIGFAIGSKSVWLDRKDCLVNVLAITIRSAGYETEWASNVKLGISGEAKGFAEAAKQVKEGVDHYLDIKGLAPYVEGGNFLFYVTGFSRGGATANLVAKRLIDEYQPMGNEVVAYCMEAPQGGVASEEQTGRDYTSIHNVINVDDLVPYVAPSVMGFKRYGVDHYVFDQTHDSKSLKKNSLFPNNVADNEPVAKLPDDYKAAMLKQLAMIVPNEKEQAKHTPYIMGMYELKLPSFSIEKVSGMTTSAFLQKFMNGFAGSTNRKAYASDGLEKAVANFLVYKNAGANLEDLKSVFSKLGIASLVGDTIVPILITAVGSGIAKLIDEIIEILGYDAVCAKWLDHEFQKELASKVANKIVTNCNAASSLDKYYPGKATQARTDIYYIVKAVLNGLPALNDIITLAKGIEDVLQNHSFMQSISYMRAADDWYDNYEKPQA